MKSRFELVLTLLFIGIFGIVVVPTLARPWIIGWHFKQNVQEGMNKTHVLTWLEGKKYTSYVPEQYEELLRELSRIYYPVYDFSEAHEVLVVNLYADRIGIVLFNRDGKVYKRWVART